MDLKTLNAYRVFGGETEARRPPRSLDLCRMIIFKRTIKKSDWRTNRLD
jgi:hypothetical protein